jgi:hypothetical protein
VTALDVRVRQGFVTAGVPDELVDEVLDAFAEAKRRFYRDDLRPFGDRGWEVLGGCLPNPAVDHDADVHAARWQPAKVPTLIGTLEQVTSAPDSVRFHIPRTLRLIYDMRSKRDVAHLADGIDPNQQDATLVVRNMEWVLAELVRLFHNVSPAEAHGIIADLVSKDVPLIQVFDGFPRVLRQLKASDHFLVLLYWRGTEGATLDELKAWARAPMRSQSKRTLNGLDDKDLIHPQGGTYVLTHLGERDVEQRQLLEPQ